MNMKLLIISMVIGSAFALHQQKDVSGSWVGSAKTPDGADIPLNYIFKADNGVLTGSTQGTRKTYTIVDGKVVGDSLFFTIVVDNGSHIKNSGKYIPAGDSVNLTINFMGADMHGVLKRNVGGN